MEQIKGKYDNLKTKARKAVAAEKTYIKGTGGGKCMKTENPVIDAVLNILNVKTVVGLQPEFDCDAVVLNVGMLLCDHTVVNIGMLFRL